MDLWNTIWRQRASEWTFAPLSAEQAPDGLIQEAIPAGTAYLNIMLHKMRVTDVRKGLTKFYAAVHSFVSLPHLSGELARFNTVTTPTELKGMDARNLDRIISLNHRLLGPVPYVGGDLELTLGLFSIKSTDLAGPYLSLLEGMATAAGVSYVNLALPFVQPIAEGVNLLAGAESDSILEIGVSTVFPEPRSGYYLIMRAPKGSVDISQLHLDQDFQVVDRGGKGISEYPYMVFSVRPTQQRDEWFLIPEVATAYKPLRNHVQNKRINEAREAFAVFKSTALTSPDLLQRDADRLVTDVEKNMKKALGTTLTAGGTAVFPALEEIHLFE